jgi:hypothetical protein
MRMINRLLSVFFLLLLSFCVSANTPSDVNVYVNTESVQVGQAIFVDSDAYDPDVDLDRITLRVVDSTGNQLSYYTCSLYDDDHELYASQGYCSSSFIPMNAGLHTAVADVYDSQGRITSVIIVIQLGVFIIPLSNGNKCLVLLAILV